MPQVLPAPSIPMLRPLRHRPFTLLWAGQSLSRIGDGVLFVALPWLVYDLTGSPVVMGTVAMLQNLPMLALLLVGGVAVDRLPRQRVMLASDILRGLLVGTIALDILAGQLQLWHLQAMAVAFGVAAAFFRPAYSAVMPQMVPREELVPANALMSGSRSLAEVGGPMLGAVLVAAGGSATAFAFDAATFGVSTLCLLAMGTAGSVPGSAGKRAVWEEAREGFRVVVTTTWVLLAITICAMGNAVASGSYMVALPLLVRVDLGGEVGVLGTLQGAVAAGAMVGLFTLGQCRMRHRGVWFYGCILINGLAIAGWGMSAGLPWAVVSALFFGATGGLANVAYWASIQELVPQQMLGRVTSIDMLGSLALTPVGMMVAGVVAEVAGPAPVFLLGGILVIAMALTGLVLPQARRFEKSSAKWSD